MSDGHDRIPDKSRQALVLVGKSCGRDLVVRTLQGLGMEVSLASGPYDAIAQFFDAPAKLLVLSLAGLKRRDRMLLREVRRISPDLRVLLLVPPARRADVLPFLEAGADAMLVEPYYPAELEHCVVALLRSAATDPLTGLPNRAAYLEAGLREINRADREHRTLGLAILDLDYFKRLNRSVGYQSADTVLREAARRIRQAIRLPDLVARWGGEEFVVLLGALPADPGEALRHALEAIGRARREFARPIAVDGGAKGERQVTFSAGIALYPHEAQDLQRLFNVASERLDAAKQRGRDRSEPEAPPSSGDTRAGGPPSGDAPTG